MTGCTRGHPAVLNPHGRGNTNAQSPWRESANDAEGGVRPAEGNFRPSPGRCRVQFELGVSLRATAIIPRATVAMGGPKWCAVASEWPHMVPRDPIYCLRCPTLPPVKIFARGLSQK